MSIIKEPSVWWWPRCVSSEDQSSCLRQTGCNQACHIDHHQALLHHRRSIHHCIGGAAHSLVTAPTPLQPPSWFLSNLKKKIENHFHWATQGDLIMMLSWMMRDIKGFCSHAGSWECDTVRHCVTVPRNDKQGVTFQLSLPTQAPNAPVGTKFILLSI